MKKFLYILLLMIIIIPFNTYALSIGSTTISSSKEEEVGNTFFATISIGFNGLDKKSTNSDGIGAIMYQLDFDDSVLSITDVMTDFYDSSIYKDSDGYYILSIVDNDSTGNKCIDGVLACSDYEAKVYFYVKNTDKEETTIKLQDIGVGYYRVDEDGYYEEDDVKEAEITSNKTTTIKIKQTNKEIKSEPKSNIVSSSKPSVESDKVFSVIQGENQKTNTNDFVESTTDEEPSLVDSSNNYLKTLSIKDYFLNFEKNKYNYVIKIPQTVNKLKLSIETEDSNAKYTVVGADDLKKNNDIVKINVTSQDGHKSVYVISVKREKLSNAEANQIMTKLNTGAIIISGCVFILLVLAKIVSVMNRRKLNKLIK